MMTFKNRQYKDHPGHMMVVSTSGGKFTVVCQTCKNGQAKKR